MLNQDPNLIRELDSRSADRISVRLLWRPADDRVLVAVADARTGNAFELEVCEGERALDVFHHPYAYAARREIAPDGSSRRLSPAPFAVCRSHVTPI
jgi:hypothetical protein